jgi:hypothetical protein
VRRSRPVLHPVDADRLLHEIDLVPLQIDLLVRAEPVAIGDQHRGGIAVTVPAVLAGDHHQPFDLGFDRSLPPGNFFRFCLQGRCLSDLHFITTPGVPPGQTFIQDGKVKPPGHSFSTLGRSK